MCAQKGEVLGLPLPLRRQTESLQARSDASGKKVPYKEPFKREFLDEFLSDYA
jgi:hypothetical protein